jgi:hypothetical protein
MEKMNGMMMKDEDKQALLDNRADRFNMLTNNPATQLAQNSKKGGEYGYEGGGGSNQAPPLIVANVNAYVYVEAKINANVTINICAPATKPAEPPKSGGVRSSIELQQVGECLPVRKEEKPVKVA